MEFNIKNLTPNKQPSDCLIIGVFEKGELTPAAKQIDEQSQGYVQRLVEQGDIQGKIGQILLLRQIPNIVASRILLVGCGEQSKLNETQYQKIISHAFKWLKHRPFKEISCYLTELPIPKRDIHWLVKQAILYAHDVFYQFDQFKTKKENKNHLDKISFFVPSTQNTTLSEQAILEANATATGMHLAKDLANLPSNVCTPSYLADTAMELAKNYSSLKAKEFDEKALRKMGMGAFVAVSQGSQESGKLIVVEYRGADKAQKPIALVGKGITFDTGGISLKPSRAMDEMKADMCGAASVLGAMKAIAELQLPINVVAVIASAENMPGGAACKPGDIVTTLSGQTVEILNTDAEGRLVLCDALTYTQQQFDPEIIIDLATLTGAVIVALGYIPTGLLSNNDHLAKELLLASKQSYDRLWQLPLWEDYQSHLDSPFADIANISDNGAAGTIMAACFLSRFINDVPWAHLDIAATSFNSGKNKGATGRPVPLLMQYLLNRANGSC